MKAGASLLCLLWFAAASYAGYHLTARSFAWVDKPNMGLPAQADRNKIQPAKIPAIDLNAIKAQLPPKLLEQAKSLTSKQLLCLKASVSPNHLQAALQGILTPEELMAVGNCLK